MRCLRNLGSRAVSAAQLKYLQAWLMPKVVIAAVTALATPAVAFGSVSHPLEHSVCGWIKEPAAFWIWRRFAGSPVDMSGEGRITYSTFETQDHRKLIGFRYGSSSGVGPKHAQGALLFAQGNAMLASHIIERLRPFANSGLDVFVFDFRGYGLSQGVPRLIALISDYHDIARRLLADGYRHLYLYGVSLGAVILVNAAVGIHYSALALDSLPSRVSTRPFTCPKTLDPVTVLPENTSDILVVAGGSDNLVPPEESHLLRVTVAHRGGTEMVLPGIGHPDLKGRSWNDRTAIVLRFFNAMRTRQ